MARESDESAAQVRTIRAEPGCELRYINRLLTTMGRGGASSFEIVSDAALPGISAMELRDSELKPRVSPPPLSQISLTRLDQQRRKLLIERLTPPA
jgi:hypothetical protein